MEKPYIRKFGKVSDFDIWIVDGKHIRKHIDPEFTNFAHHFNFNFIPENELWIDKLHSEREENYFIDHMLVEHKLMKEGKTHDEAMEQADMFELDKRNVTSFIKNKKKVLKKVYKKLLKTYSKKIKVWVVNGKSVRDLFYVGFTLGGHDKVYSFIPNGEVWIDDQISQKERKYIILHELHERYLMSNGWDYDGFAKSAHKDSNRIEHFCRHNPEELDKMLRVEIDKNN